MNNQRDRRHRVDGLYVLAHQDLEHRDHEDADGAESGPNRRDCGVDPIVSIARQCQAAGVPVFVKQDCAFKPGQQGRIPDDIWKLKQFPEGR